VLRKGQRAAMELKPGDLVLFANYEWGGRFRDRVWDTWDTPQKRQISSCDPKSAFARASPSLRARVDLTKPGRFHLTKSNAFRGVWKWDMCGAAGPGDLRSTDSARSEIGLGDFHITSRYTFRPLVGL
jgi:hypothetical protein